MSLHRCQWKLFHRTRNSARQWTSVHLFDPAATGGNYGSRFTLCGERFYPEDADLDDKACGRECKKCARAALAKARGEE